MQLTQEEQKFLSTYQKWLKENNLNGNCNAYFISKTSLLVFQVWEFEKLISETIWLKNDNQEWKFYIKTLGEKFNKYFSLNEILEIEKNFVWMGYTLLDTNYVDKWTKLLKERNYNYGQY